MNTLKLPKPIAAYFEADQRDGHAVAHCFTHGGRVTDEGRTHQGREAIEAWKNATSRRFSYRADPVSLAVIGQQSVVTGRVSGNFPGSPVHLTFKFHLERDQVASLEITP